MKTSLSVLHINPRANQLDRLKSKHDARFDQAALRHTQIFWRNCQV
uniref:Uncharacterized protein n=1 Tax=Rhizophora mucronata TaxID=61149 RepID=A0A2P2MR32_RHIMU